MQTCAQVAFHLAVAGAVPSAATASIGCASITVYNNGFNTAGHDRRIT